jgi:hypothetical protein
LKGPTQSLVTPPAKRPAWGQRLCPVAAPQDHDNVLGDPRELDVIANKVLNAEFYGVH